MYDVHLCSERGCEGTLRRAHERVRQLRHDRVMGKIRAAGRPTLHVRALADPPRSMPRGPDLDVAWIDEPVAWVTPAPALRVKPPFNLREVAPPPNSRIDDAIREHMLDFDRKLLAEWEAMLADLPAPPEGKAWFPVTEMDDQIDWDSNRATITYRLRPELRDA